MDFLKKLEEASAKDKNLDWANLLHYWKENRQLNLSLKNSDRIVFMGDSITQEWGNLYPEVFTNEVLINRGIGGQTTPQMLIRFRQDVLDLNPSIVVILAGTNDIAGNTGPSTEKMIVDNIFSMCELAITHRIKPILCSILPVFEYPWAVGVKNVPEIILDINQMLESFATKNNLPYIDYYTNMVNLEGGLIAEYTYDGVHPNKKGYETMSVIIQEILDN